MLRTTLFAVSIIALCVGVFYSGPRVTIDTRVAATSLPADFERYLAESERRIAGIRPGVAKRIIWAGSKRTRTDYALLYLHGFSATQREVYPLCDVLARELGANLYYTRLRGHGRDGEAMREITVNALLQDAADALAVARRLGEKVIVVGTSTGATLAAWLAAQDQSADISALLLVSPNLGLRNRLSEILLLPWAEYLAPLIAGTHHEFTPQNDQHAAYWTTRYPTQALIPMMGVVELVRNIDPAAITTPAWIGYSEHDRIVDPVPVEAWYRALGSRAKALVRIEGSTDAEQHVLAGEILSPPTTAVVASHMLEFVHNLKP